MEIYPPPPPAPHGHSPETAPSWRQCPGRLPPPERPPGRRGPDDAGPGPAAARAFSSRSPGPSGRRPGRSPPPRRPRSAPPAPRRRWWCCRCPFPPRPRRLCPRQDTGTQMPTSTTCTSSPKYAANADIPVLCRVMFTACCTVTDWGAQDTPSATTPLSAASTVTRHRRTSGRAVRRIPASRMDISSSAPRLPGGLASSACRRRAASMASRSAGRMDSIYAVNSCLVMCSLHIRVPAATQETGRSPDFPM